MDAMGVYYLVPRPPGKNVMKTRMIYKVKTDSAGVPTKRTARFVCLGFTGRYGVNYRETFAPTPEPKTFKLLCSLLAQGPEWQAEQSDISAAFLNADVMMDEIYCEQPKYREHVHGQEHYVWRLRKSLFGMKN